MGEEEVGPAGGTGNGRVLLLIDDEPKMGSLVDMVVGDPQVTVIQVGSFAEAIQAAREHPPWLILLDISLGSEDGLTLLPQLRKEPSISNTPIIVFSVHASQKQEAIDLGADDFVPKPFQVAEMRAKLQKFAS